VANFAALAVNDAVEVHGSRDTTSAIRATRVEKLNANPLGDEFKGVVATKTGTTSGDFTLTGSTSTFTYSASTVLPNGMFGVADLVEVHLSGTAATRIEIEDLEDDKFKPSQNQEVEVEGYVTGFSGTPGAFQVGGQAVQTTSSTRYEGGLSSDLANDVKVEAEGHYQGTTLVADKIKFKDSVRFEANLEAVSLTGGTVRVLGRTVIITSRTDQSPRDGSFLVGEGVRIRAFLNQDKAAFTATRIDEDSNPIDANRIIVQGLVIDSSNNQTIVLVDAQAGFTVNTDRLSDLNFKDDNDASIGRTAFFSNLKLGRTVVKARGSYSSGTLTAAPPDGEVEIE
jgi:hypothetical protein